MRSNEIIESVLFWIGTSLLWLAFSLLGLLVLGIAPATCAAADVMRARAQDESPHLFRVMWRAYREQFIRANLRLLPLILIQVASIGSLSLAVRTLGHAPGYGAAMATISTLAGAWATSSLMVMVASPRVRRQDWPVTMRLALLFPGAIPLRSLLALFAVALWSLLSIVLPPVGALLGPAGAVRIADALLRDPVATVLATIDAAHSDAAADDSAPQRHTATGPRASSPARATPAAAVPTRPQHTDEQD